MDHFWRSIPGWFQGQDIYAGAVSVAKDGDIFVEVGSWKGRSAAFMAVEIANSGKQIDFYCVDHWQGSNERAHHNDPDVIAGSLFDTFKANTKPVEHIIKPIQASSLDAAATFDNGSLAFVYLDAAHDYESVKNDIRAWLPKIRAGGTLAGDDFSLPWSGVIAAVNEMLPGRTVYGSQWVFEI